LKMIILGYYFTGKPSFQNIYLHGLIRDSQGRKMSKSLGNGVEPEKIMEKYGTDSLRLFLLENNILGADLTYEESKIKDSLILTHPKVLAASGHLKNFHDWLIECLNCQKRYRLDNLISPAEFAAFLAQTNKQNFPFSPTCSHCGKNKFTSPREFNLLLSSDLQATSQEKKNMVYLRPETCQGIFINFAALQRSTRKKLPWGEKIKQVSLTPDELPHYAKKTTDLYFQYHFGWGELCSISDRSDYDLKNHSQKSGVRLETEGIIPPVIEVSFGVERLLLAVLEDAYQAEMVENSPASKREVLKIHPLLAPYLVAVIPLSKQLQAQAQQIYQELLTETNFTTTYEESSSIGKSYRRQDAIGTYYCLTVDFQTLQDDTPSPQQLQQNREQKEALSKQIKEIEKNIKDNRVRLEKLKRGEERPPWKTIDEFGNFLVDSSDKELVELANKKQQLIEE
ncbi:18739_t:CDS:2, partial [Funneliformis geosporum]